MDKIKEAQKRLAAIHADGWLLYDFHRSNPLAHTFLSIPSSQLVTRRFFYWIPTVGTPIKIVHAIEPHILDALPGEKRTYSSWQSLEKEVGGAVAGAKKIAMEYSPRNAIPYVSKVDAGTVDFISSAEILPHFTAVMDEKQAFSHERAARAAEQVSAETWEWIAAHLKHQKE